MSSENTLQSILNRTTAALRLTQNQIRMMTNEKTLQTIVERATAAVTIRPAIGQGTDATTVRLLEGTKCTVEQGPWQLRSELEPELGGSNQYPGPGFFLRAALGTCFAQTAALWAAKLGVPIDHMEVEVRADHDARGLLGVGDEPPRFTELRYTITAASTASEADVQQVLDAAHEHSPVRGNLEHEFKVSSEVEILEPESTHE